MEQPNKPQSPLIDYQSPPEDRGVLRGDAAKRVVAIVFSLVFAIIAGVYLLKGWHGPKHYGPAMLAAVGGAAFCFLVAMNRVR
ncbi:MAG: hypothetical protein JWN51_1719 [Phycisphaerales bacterium]|nr:hypothetical protein [Phycisphaerales bacterium]